MSHLTHEQLTLRNQVQQAINHDRAKATWIIENATEGELQLLQEAVNETGDVAGLAARIVLRIYGGGEVKAKKKAAPRQKAVKKKKTPHALTDDS